MKGGAMENEEEKAVIAARLPEDLAEWVRERARRNRRSVSAEVTVILEAERDRERREGLKQAS
jgi:hypothetical protein